MRIRANWWLDPKSVAKLLVPGIKLVEDDFFPIKKFEFGELGYDYEEGLVFWTDEHKLTALVEWIKAFHKENEIPFRDDKEDLDLFQVKDCGPDLFADDDVKGIRPEFKTVAESAGLTMHDKYDFVAKLVA